MAHFKALSLYHKKMIVVLAKSDAIHVKIAFISRCLENTDVNFVRFFSTSLKSKSFARKDKPFSPLHQQLFL